MSQASLKLGAVLLSVLLVACGGGGGGGDATPATNEGNVDTNGSASGGSGSVSQDGTPPTSPDSSGGTPTSPVSPAPITATVTTAPAEGASLSGTVRLEVRGNSIENAELLPPDGYSPRLGVFTVSVDKTMAWLDFDTRSLPNGTLLARISAFDKPAGSSGATEVIAMATRSWLLRNDPPPAPAQIPAASYMPEVHISSLALPYVDPQPLSAMMALNDTDYDVMLQTEWPRVEGVMHQYIPPNVVLMPPTPLGFSGPWYSCLESHLRLACREAMNNMIGLMMGKQP